MRYLWMILFVLSAMIAAQEEEEQAPAFSDEELIAAARVMGLEFDEAERSQIIKSLGRALSSYEAIRGTALDNGIAPSLVFSPLPPGFRMPDDQRAPRFVPPGEVRVPEEPADLAFMTVPELAELIRTRKITSVALTELYLERLETHGPKLEAVITLMRDSALEKARAMDAELDAGKYRGNLHGIPYGIKDLFATPDAPTTWGAKPYQRQMIETRATVIDKLDEAGAVLLAKLTLGALAMGDYWYGGQTRNPWNLEQGSSGSSAGSAATTSAGLVAFAIGTETWGSIVSPATRCGTTGLRPTFGAISRYGAMALSWSMDKVGPITRSVDGAAMVYDVIRGADGKDMHAVDAPFPYRPAWVDLSELRIGYLEEAFAADYPFKENDQRTLDELRELGAKLEPIALPELPIGPLSIILTAEAAAAFDALTREGKDAELVRQTENSWPNIFRAARFIPAVEYINANRVRAMLIAEMDTLMRTYDLYITPTYGGNNLLLTNLTGHPCVVVPNGFTDRDPSVPTSITFMGRLFDEATLLGAVRRWQQATEYHRQHPPLFR